jgi:hypothetical protein
MKRILKNFKTSIAGSIAGLPVIIEGINQGNIIQIISGIGMLIVGLLAKDSDNTTDGK